MKCEREDCPVAEQFKDDGEAAIARERAAHQAADDARPRKLLAANDPLNGPEYRVQSLMSALAESVERAKKARADRDARDADNLKGYGCQAPIIHDDPIRPAQTPEEREAFLAKLVAWRKQGAPPYHGPRAAR